MLQHPKVSIIGTGSWGSALALTMAKQGHPILLWGHNPHHVEDIKVSRINAAYVPGVIFPKNIHLTSNIADCADSSVIFFVVPSRFLRAITTTFAAACRDSSSIMVACTKGIEPGTGKLMSEVIKEIIPKASVAVLSGPNLARDIANGLPAAGVLGCDQENLFSRLQLLFQGTSYRVYTSTDVRGIQLGGALKNIFAIAAGVSDALGMGENAKAGIVTRSLAEMTRLGVAMGGERATFSGLSGIGDLMATCFSQQSRNYQAGLQLCHGKSAGEIQDSMAMVAEGLITAKSAQECAQKWNVDVPIIDAVVGLLEGKKRPHEAMRELLGRRLRSEEEL